MTYVHPVPRMQQSIHQPRSVCEFFLAHPMPQAEDLHVLNRVIARFNVRRRSVTKESDNQGHMRQIGSGPVFLPASYRRFSDPQGGRHVLLSEIQIKAAFPVVISQGNQGLGVVRI